MSCCERHDTGARRATGGHARRSVLEYQACRWFVAKTLSGQQIGVWRGLSTRHVFARHEDLRDRHTSSLQAPSGEHTPSGGGDRPRGDREERQESQRPLDRAEASGACDLGGFKPRHFRIEIEVRRNRLQGLARAAPVCDAKQRLGIELMTLRPAPPRPLDSGARIDQHTVKVEQQGFASELAHN